MQNTQNRTLWALVIIIALFAIIGLGYKYGVGGSSATPSTSSGTTSSPQAAATPLKLSEQVLNYANPDYGYSISFPGTMGVARGATGITIQPVYPADKTSISDAFMEIAANVGKCTARAGQNVVTLDTIKGVPFTVTKGVSGTTNFVEYRADKNGICYLATLTINVKASADAAITDTNKKVVAGLQSQFSDIVKSFGIKDSITAPKNPIINSISPVYAKIGATVTIKGVNLGSSADVWMIDESEQLGRVDAANVTSDGSKITVKIPSKICTTTETPCAKSVPVNPGQYSFFTQPSGKSSNTVSFTVAQ